MEPLNDYILYIYDGNNYIVESWRMVTPKEFAERAKNLQKSDGITLNLVIRLPYDQNNVPYIRMANVIERDGAIIFEDLPHAV